MLLVKRKKAYLMIVSFLLLTALALSVSGCAFLPLPIGGGGSSDGASNGRGISAGVSGSAGDSSTAVTITNLKTCREQKDRKCPSNVDIFSPDDPRISATATVTNVTVGMQARIIWRFLGNESVAPFVVADSTVTVEEASANRPLVSTIEKKSPDADWAKGLYVVEISVQAGGEQKSWKQFRVE